MLTVWCQRAPLFRGGPGVDYGQFFHLNTVDEVAHVFGGNGALLQTGQIYATQKLHGVNSFLKDSTNPENFLVTAITQHQRASGPQNEAVIFRCGNATRSSSATSTMRSPRRRGMHPRNGVPLFTTLQGSVDAAETLNEHPSNRHCENAATIIRPFRWTMGLATLRRSVHISSTPRDSALDAAAAQVLAQSRRPGKPWTANAC